MDAPGRLVTNKRRPSFSGVFEGIIRTYAEAAGEKGCDRLHYLIVDQPSQHICTYVFSLIV